MHDPINPPPRHPATTLHQAQQIEALIAADQRIDHQASHVRVLAHAETVGLVGWVSRLPEKRWIEEMARDVAGPDRVQSCLVVGPPGQRPDPAIERAVRDSLMQDRWIDASSIQVRATNGVVRLSGVVETSFDRRLAGALCWWVQGVRGVVNDLSVIYPEPDNDEILAQTIQAMMDKDPLVDVTEVLVLCQHGVVTLAGTVAGAAAREAAENDAWIVDGVREVMNQIELAPGGAATTGSVGSVPEEGR